MRGALALVMVVTLSGCATAGSNPIGASGPPTTASPTPTGAPSSSVLVFQMTSPPRVQFTLTDSSGKLINTIDTAGAGGSMWQGGSSALLVYGPTSGTYSVLDRHGLVTPVPAALAPLFDAGSPAGFGAVGGDPILLDSRTVLGMDAGRRGDARYELVSLDTGQVTTLLHVTADVSPTGLAPSIAVPLGTSLDRTVAHVLVVHATADGTPVQGWAVVDIDLAQRRVKAIHQLPDFGTVPFTASSPALSPDGRLLAFQTAQNPSATTHLVDTATGKETTMADQTVSALGAVPARFAPDGSALVVYGVGGGGTGDAVMIAFSTQNEQVIARLDVGGTFNNQIVAVGWVGAHTLAYVTNQSAGGGTFDSNSSVAHTIDLASGDTHDLRNPYGGLVSVLT